MAKPGDRCAMFRVTTTMGEILTTARSSPAYCQPLKRPNPAGVHNLPHLLESSDPYWSSDALPKPQATQAVAQQDPEYEVVEKAILMPDSPPHKSEGELGLKTGGSSLGRPSHSFRTGSTEIPRESDDLVRSSLESVTPATTRQPSVMERESHDSRRPELTERNEEVAASPHIKISKVTFEDFGGEDNMAGRVETPISSKRQAVKTQVRMWKRKIKLSLCKLIRLSRE